jgi:two-component system, NtrC family, sensor kinase
MEEQATGRILVVEDDPEVADVCAAALEEFGYSVKRVESAHKAIEMLATENEIDLVFSDVVMPAGMSGVQMARVVRERFPDLPVLLTTGYSSAAMEALSAGFPILNKPYRIDALRRAIGNMLGPRRSTNH